MIINEIVLTIANIKGIGNKTLNLLMQPNILELTDVKDIYHYINSVKIPKFNPQRISLDMVSSSYEHVAKILEDCKKHNIGCITKYDSMYPKNFKTIKDVLDAPAYFFYKGNVECLNKTGISIIGTREVSKYGYRCGHRLSQVLTEKGYTIISGLAIGCDSAGHEGCVDANGTSVAILSHGLDFIYPKVNEKLAQRILDKNGCLISEYPVGTKVSAYNLVARDRLQAYLADALIVIETGVKGGTLHAFNKAINEGMPVAAISYDQNHYEQYIHAQGNKKFIEEGSAFPITNSDSICEFLKLINKKETSNDDEVFEQQVLF